MTNIELVRKVKEVIDAHSEDPADDLIRSGEALVAVGKILKGLGRAECVAIMTAAAAIL